MANIIRPTNGSISSWTSGLFTATDFNSLPNGDSVVATSAVAQHTNLDDYLELSFSVVVGGTTTISSYFALFLLPLNQDGSTYGDGSGPGGSGYLAYQPAFSYQVANCGVKSGVTSGNAVTGFFPRVYIGDLDQDFLLAIGNNLGVALASSAAATFKYRTVNTNGNG